MILFEYIFVLLIFFLILIIKKNEKNSLVELGSALTFFMIASVRCVPLISSILSNMQIVKAKKLGVRPKIFFFSKLKKDYGNGSADICLGIQAAGQAGHSLSM